MQGIAFWLYGSKDDIAYMQLLWQRCEQGFVAIVLQIGAHAIAPEGERDGMALLNEFADVGDEYVVAYLHR